MKVCKLILRAWKIVCTGVYLSLSQLSWGMLPIKGCDSLEDYDKIHQVMAYKNVEVLSARLSEKLKKIDQFPDLLIKTVGDIRDEIQANQHSIEKIGKPFMEPLAIPKKNLESSILQLTKKLEAIDAEMQVITGKKLNLVTCDGETVFPGLVEYKDAFIKKICTEIDSGDYSTLLGSFPSCFFVPAHVPNTFTCAFTLKISDEESINVFVKNNEQVFIITPEVEDIFVFESGDSDKDFFKYSLLAQTFSLSGSVPTAKMNKVSNTPSDLYRHSEQKSFEGLNIVEFVNAIASCVSKPVSEIIYHGNTIRDMCPNCRATLVAYEILAIKNEINSDIDLPDSFLCAIQNKFFEKFKKKPIVTCLISSFIEYDNREKDVTWVKDVPVNLIDLSKRSPRGICSRFLNQFAFSEKVFLEMLIKTMSQQKTTDACSSIIVSALNSRLSKI